MFHKSTIAISSSNASIQDQDTKERMFTVILFKGKSSWISTVSAFQQVARTGKMAETDFLWKYTLCPTKTSAYTFKTLVELCNYHKKSSNVYSLKRQRMEVDGKESLM